MSPELARDGDPGAVGEYDVEQHEVWAEPFHGGQRLACVGSLADDGETAAREHPARELPEVRVVVDDEHALHGFAIVAPAPSGLALNPDPFRAGPDDASRRGA
jgi:hypothetical protein